MIFVEHCFSMTLWTLALFGLGAVQSDGQQATIPADGQEVNERQIVLARGGQSQGQSQRATTAQAEQNQSAEPAEEASSEPEMAEIRVFRLKHAEPHSVARTVAELFSKRHLAVAVDARLNALIVRDASGGLNLASVERLITDLDKPDDAEGLTLTEIVKLKHRDAEDVVTVLRRSHEHMPVETGFDSASQSVLLTGRRDQVKELASLIDEIDKPQEPIRLSFFFLKGQRDGEDPSASEQAISELPEELRPVGRSLVKSGFARPGLLAPLSANTMEDARFQTAGFISTGEHLEGLDLHINGRVRQGTRSGTTRVEIESEVIRAKRDPREAGVIRHAVFRLQTTLVAKLGDYVVLAAAPSSNEAANELLALVVRVEQGG